MWPQTLVELARPCSSTFSFYRLAEFPLCQLEISPFHFSNTKLAIWGLTLFSLAVVSSWSNYGPYSLASLAWKQTVDRAVLKGKCWEEIYALDKLQRSLTCSSSTSRWRGRALSLRVSTSVPLWPVVLCPGWLLLWDSNFCFEITVGTSQEPSVLLNTSPCAELCSAFLID